MADTQGQRFLSVRACVGRFPLTLKLGKFKLEMEKKNVKKIFIAGKILGPPEATFQDMVEWKGLVHVLFTDISEGLLEFC